MALVINTNIASIQSERALAMNRGNMQTAMERLSSGKRINSAIDDASGIAVAQRMSNQIKGLNMAIKNANDGISMAQTAEGSMEELQNILQRMRELATQSSNGTYTSADRSYINAEFSELIKEVRRVSTQAYWDGQVELIGENAKPMYVQVGLNAADYIEVPLKSCTIEDLNLADTKNIANSGGATVTSFYLGAPKSTSTFAAADTTVDAPTGTAQNVGYSTVLDSSNQIFSGSTTITDVKFGASSPSQKSAAVLPLPTFQLSYWDGSRNPDGTPDTNKTVNLSAGPVASLSDLVAQFKAHSNYDPTVCDIQNVNGRLQVVWKIAGAPAAPSNGSASLSIVNYAPPSPAVLGTTPTTSGSAIKILPDGTSGYNVSGTTIATASARPGTAVSCIPQSFDLSSTSSVSWFVPPGPDNHFEFRVGNRVLSADNVTSVDDLATKLQQDSDYAFVLEEAGHQPGFPMFEATGSPATLKAWFGKYANNLGTLRQTTNNVTIADPDKAINALDYCDKAANVINDRRARMGATMSRIEYTINNLMNVVQNTEEAKSRILDTDYAAESANLARAQVLAQAGTAMLAQANQSQQYVLNLLKGM